MRKTVFHFIVLFLLLAAGAAAQTPNGLLIDKLEASVNTSPGGGQLDIKLTRGNVVKLLETGRGWYSVELRNGERGWVPGWDGTPIVLEQPMPPLPDISGASPAAPVYARVAVDAAPVRTDPTNLLAAAADHTRIAMLDRGVLLKIVGVKGNWCKVELAADLYAWTYNEQLEYPLEPQRGLAPILSITRAEGAGSVGLAVALPRRTPYSVTTIGNTVELSLYNADIDANVVENLQLPPELVTIARGPEGRIVIRYALDYAPFGFSARYMASGTPGNEVLALGIKKPRPAIPGRPLAGYRIAIDPGHGAASPLVGFRGGTSGPEGVTEHETNLKVGLKLRDILTAQGAEVVMTRTGLSDEMASLYARTGLAMQFGADIFISIHCNGSESSAAHGLEIYWFEPQSLYLAQALAQVMPTHINTGPGTPIFASFGVIRMTEMPAVLVEMGYMTNPTEGRLFLDDAFLDKCASGIAGGIAAYVQSLHTFAYPAN